MLDLLELAKDIEVPNDEEQLTPQTFLFYLLYLVQFTLIKRDYSSVVRQLIKLMLAELQPVISKICKLANDTSVGYLLAIFEVYIAEKKIKRDSFDLLALKQFLFEDEQLKSLKLWDAL